MLQLSIPLRQALGRLTLPVLVVAAFGIMLIGKAETPLVERLRMSLADALSPLYAVLSRPVLAVREALEDASGFWWTRAENVALREENERLRRWQAVALALDAENTQFRRQLSFVPDATPSYRTVRVVADAGGTYARAVLLATGPQLSLRKGQVALDERGLAGRVTEVGERSARVLLVTDINSNIPVVLESSRARAVMAGTNGFRPRLQHWPEGLPPQEGERVVTGAEAATSPTGLPVGVVHWSLESGVPEVELFARLERLDLLRVFDFGLSGILPPEAVARPEQKPR